MLWENACFAWRGENWATPVTKVTECCKTLVCLHFAAARWQHSAVPFFGSYLSQRLLSVNSSLSPWFLFVYTLPCFAGPLFAVTPVSSTPFFTALSVVVVVKSKQIRVARRAISVFVVLFLFSFFPTPHNHIAPRHVSLELLFLLLLSFACFDGCGDGSIQAVVAPLNTPLDVVLRMCNFCVVSCVVTTPSSFGEIVSRSRSAV